MREIVDQFYDAVRTGDVPALEALIAEDFSLICPAQNNVLSGVYRGKSRFFEAVLPQVFGCVNPEDITEIRFELIDPDAAPTYPDSKGRIKCGRCNKAIAKGRRPTPRQLGAAGCNWGLAG